MRYVDTAEMGGDMNPAGADVAITDTIPPTPATHGEPAVRRAVTSAYRLITRRRLDPAALGDLAAPVSSYLRHNHEADALTTRAHPLGRNSS